MLNRFSRWFASAAGVWQTLVATTAVVLLEQFGVIPDRSGFWLLYWLTFYSAITQPVLAYTNRSEGLEDNQFFTRIEALEVKILDALQEQGAAEVPVRQEAEGGAGVPGQDDQIRAEEPSEEGEEG